MVVEVDVVVVVVVVVVEVLAVVVDVEVVVVLVVVLVSDVDLKLIMNDPLSSALTYFYSPLYWTGGRALPLTPLQVIPCIVSGSAAPGADPVNGGAAAVHCALEK